MNETTSTPQGQGRERSPEYRLAKQILGGPREELFRGAFAYRPLPPARFEGPLADGLPAALRRQAGFLPHAAVVGLAMISLAAGYFGGGGSNQLAWALGGSLPAAAVLLTLVRPVLAFWCSLAAVPLSVALTSSGFYPWTPQSIVGHTAVMTVVAARTRPRTAAWMWAFTVLYALMAESAATTLESNSVPMLMFSGIAVALVTLVQANRTTRREVVQERTVTAVERDRRTLLEERTTIARELHDVVAHHMSVVAIQAEAAPYRVQNPPPELEQAFVTIRENAVAALTELRRVLGVVRAEDYEAPDAPQPTLADLDGLLANVRETGLDVEKVVTGAVRELPQGVELSAYRIVQEALSNSLRHAPGASARVEVGYVLGGLGLRIVNGPARGLVKPPARHPATAPRRGLRPPLSMGAGHGLTGMRERVTMLDGEMTAEETPEGGYEVTVFLPVRTPAPEGTTA